MYAHNWDLKKILKFNFLFELIIQFQIWFGLLVILRISLKHTFFFLYSDFVYYEGDGFEDIRNPYVPLDVDNPTIYGNVNQRLLIGEGHAFEERKKILKNKNKNVIPFIFGKLCQNHKDYYKTFADELKAERTRIGGNWAVAHTNLLVHHARDYFRSILSNIP